MMNFVEHIKHTLRVREYNKRVKSIMKSEEENTPCRQQGRRIERECMKLKVQMGLAPKPIRI